MMLDKLRREFWWWMQTRPCRYLWEFASQGNATCWLDWLPAWASNHYGQAQARIYKRERTKAQEYRP